MSRWIDCTHSLGPDTAPWPSDSPMERTLVASMERGDVTDTSDIRLSAHYGTHIDAPSHIIPGGMTIDKISPDILCGQCRVINLDLGRNITAEDIDALPNDLPERVLIITGCPDTISKGTFPADFRSLEPLAAQRLIDRGIKLVGFDSPSADPLDSHDLPAHRILLGAGIVNIESIRLVGISEGEYELIALPIKLTGADGAPARVLLKKIEP